MDVGGDDDANDGDDGDDDVVGSGVGRGVGSGVGSGVDSGVTSVTSVLSLNGIDFLDTFGSFATLLFLTGVFIGLLKGDIELT